MSRGSSARDENPAIATTQINMKKIGFTVSVCATDLPQGNLKFPHCRPDRRKAFCNWRSQISNASKITAKAQFFARNSDEAREVFYEACRGADVTPVPYYAPSEIVSDSRPIVEVARFGRGDARHAIVITGGSWEDEGLCAAGIQSGLLHEPLAERLPPNVALILVHAIAPPGFAEPALNLAESPTTRWTHRALAAAESRFTTFMDEGGPRTTAAIAGKPWQAVLLRRLSDQFVAGLDRICLLDIRTGPSQFGNTEILCCADDGTIAHRRAAALFAEDGADTLIPAGGSPGDFAKALLTAWEGANISAAVLEFGTYSIGSILGVGGDRIFYPQQGGWRDIVWQSAARTTWRTAIRLGAAAPASPSAG